MAVWRWSSTDVTLFFSSLYESRNIIRRVSLLYKTRDVARREGKIKELF